MIILFLAIFGLCVGSFINALVWRVWAQENSSKKLSSKQQSQLSITKGRSMCPHCKHTLAAKDLVPVVSWMSLGGKCRYCHKPISIQYPLVEAVTSLLFVISYLSWPYDWGTVGAINFAGWLVIAAGLMALVVYDIKWMLLPNRIIYPLIGVATTLAGYNLLIDGSVEKAVQFLLSVAIGGGIFYGLFTLSDGRWIGGGDVKLGFLLGLLLANAYSAFFMLLGASLLGTLVILPGLATKKLSSQSKIPFGPFLIVAGSLVYLFGAPIVDWYRESILLVATIYQR